MIIYVAKTGKRTSKKRNQIKFNSHPKKLLLQLGWNEGDVIHYHVTDGENGRKFIRAIKVVADTPYDQNWMRVLRRVDKKREYPLYMPIPQKIAKIAELIACH